MNKKRFEYHSSKGTIFECDTCDFSTPITVYAHYDSFVKEGVRFESLSKLVLPDVAEMIGYHAVNIHPELNGFQGYDCLQFNIIDPQPFYGDEYKMTTTDYVPVDALKSYIEHFVEESEKQHARAVQMFNPEDATYYGGAVDALKQLKEQIDGMKVAL